MSVRPAVLLVVLACSLPGAETPPRELPLRQPSVRSVFPLGGQAGHHVDLELEGDFLDRATVQCECDDLHVRIKSANPLRLVADVEVPANAEPGPHTLYVQSPRGSSNRFLFRVTRWASFVEAEPNDTLDKAQQVANPSVVEGRVARLTDTDFFRFHAAANERVALNVMAARSKAPGFVSLSLLTSDGRELAHNNAQIGPDPFLTYQFHEAGNYVVALTARRFADFFTVLKDDQTINWQYQLAIGRSPLLWSVYPMGGKQGSHVDAELRADFLPAGVQPRISGPGVSVKMAPIQDDCVCRYRLAIDIAADAPIGMRLLTVPDESGNLGALGFAVGSEREVLESDAKPQKVELPVTINGRISSAGEHDAYRFKVNQEDVVTLEMEARGLGSRMTDPQIALLRAQGDIVEFGDDQCRKCSPFHSVVEKKRSLDPVLTHAFISASANDADAAGEYDVVVLDNSSHGDATRTYRLTLRNKQPGYSLGVLTDHVNARAGGAAKLPVAIAREEGFNGAITVSATDLPAGWTAEPLVIPAGTEIGDLQITRTAASASEVRLEIRASAKVGEKEVQKIAELPPLLTEDGPGFLEAPRESIAVAFVPAPKFSLKVEEPSSGFVIDLKQAGRVEIPVTVERQAGFEGPLTFHVENLPDGVTLKAQRTEGNLTYLTLEAESKSAAIGRSRISATATGRVGDEELYEVTPALRLQVK